MQTTYIIKKLQINEIRFILKYSTFPLMLEKQQSFLQTIMCKQNLHLKYFPPPFSMYRTNPRQKRIACFKVIIYLEKLPLNLLSRLGSLVLFMIIRILFICYTNLNMVVIIFVHAMYCTCIYSRI